MHISTFVGCQLKCSLLVQLTVFVARYVFSVTTFLETWKCHRIWLRSEKKSEEKRPKVGEKSGSLCHLGNFIVAAQQNNLPVLYSYCNSFFVRDVHWEFGLINVHLFVAYCLRFRLKKSGDFFFVWRVITLYIQTVDQRPRSLESCWTTGAVVVQLVLILVVLMVVFCDGVESETLESSSSCSATESLMMSRRAMTHKFKKIFTLSRCRNCDSYIYMNGGLQCSWVAYLPIVSRVLVGVRVIVRVRVNVR